MPNEKFVQKQPEAGSCPGNGKARLVKIYLADGEPEGIRSAQIDISTTYAIAFKGDQLNLGVKKEYADQIQKSGVYLIIGRDPDKVDKKLVYVGESEDVGKRLNVHKGIIKANSAETMDPVGFTFWEDTLVFVSKDDNLTKAHIRYVEAELIAAIKGNHAWGALNVKNPPAAGKLPKEDVSSMCRFIEEVKILSGALGFDMFKTSKLPMPQLLPGISNTATIENPEFSFSGNGFAAKAVFLAGSTGEWVVRANSTAKLEHTPATPKGAINLRATLEADGVLKKTANGLEFTADQAFPSASSAACVVAGTSVAGPSAWKLNGKTYKEWELEMSGEAPSPAQDLLTDL